jgi:N-acetylneuraminic acid mutarotase
MMRQNLWTKARVAGLAVVLVAVMVGPGASGEWKRLPSLPDREGFAGAFAGVSHGALLVAGGANFPDKKPWEGGRKVWYDTVFVLERPAGEWKVAGKLPRPLGYGVCATHGPGVVCVGGSDADRHHADAFRLDWTGGKLVTTKLPSLPKPVANACGALVGGTLYVAGGQEKPDSGDTLSAVWTIDLSAREPEWKRIGDCPGGGRMLAVAAGFDGAFWLAGGVDLVAGSGGTVERRYRKDAYRHDPGTGWKRIADLPRPVAAAPSPAPADAAGFFVLGGDDGSQVGVEPGRHRGFGKIVLRYDPETGKWVEGGELPAPRVTAPCVRWDGRWVVPGGEVRPGVRSPEVWSWTFGH